MNCRGCTKEKKAPCEFDVPGQETWKFEDRVYQGCPFSQVTRLSADLLRAYNFYKSGFLPNAGSWLEQPSKFIEAMEAVENELARIKQEQIRKQRHADK